MMCYVFCWGLYSSLLWASREIIEQALLKHDNLFIKLHSS
jgi:hypothetical protein